MSTPDQPDSAPTLHSSLDQLGAAVDARDWLRAAVLSQWITDRIYARYHAESEAARARAWSAAEGKEER